MSGNKNLAGLLFVALLSCVPYLTQAKAGNSIWRFAFSENGCGMSAQLYLPEGYSNAYPFAVMFQVSSSVDSTQRKNRLSTYVIPHFDGRKDSLLVKSVTFTLSENQAISTEETIIGAQDPTPLWVAEDEAGSSVWRAITNNQLVTLNLHLVDDSVAPENRIEQVVSLPVSAFPQERALRVYETCIDLASAKQISRD